MTCWGCKADTMAATGRWSPKKKRDPRMIVEVRCKGFGCKGRAWTCAEEAVALFESLPERLRTRVDTRQPRG